MAPNDSLPSLSGGICLALVAFGVDHGYAVAKHFEPTETIGGIYSLSRPAVYRELAMLENDGLITSTRDRGPRGQAMKRLRPSKRGAAACAAWLNAPVEHLRDVRLDFLAKIVLREMHGLDIPAFVAAQRHQFSTLFAGLSGDAHASVTSLWRREQVRAVSRFLDELEGLTHRETPEEDTDAVVLSARNQLTGKVVSVRHGGILSSVKFALDEGQILTSTITREATDHLRLAPGSTGTAIFKATDVMMAARPTRGDS